MDNRKPCMNSKCGEIRLQRDQLLEALKIAEESLRNITGFKGTAKTFKKLISDMEGV